MRPIRPLRPMHYANRSLISSAAITASTTTTTAPTTSAAEAATAARLRLAGLGLVHGQSTSLEIRIVQRRNGSCRFLRVRHFNEAEAARAARLAVHDDLRPSHVAVGR